MVNAAGEDIGSVFAPAPLAMQTVPGAEAYALYLVLQMATVPLRIWTDCQATIDGVQNGAAWACDGQRPNARLWRAIWSILNDVGIGPHGVTVHKTKAHCSEADVQRGTTTWWQRRGNSMADERARSGARCHPVDERLDKVWPAYEHHVTLMAAYLARCTGRLGRDVARDCTAERKRRRRGAGRRRGRREPPALDRLAKVWLRAVRDAEDFDPQDQPSRRHRLWEAPVLKERHAVEGEDRDAATVTYCSRCGAYATAVPRELLGQCKGPGLRGGRTQLARLKTGKYPHAGYGTREWRIGTPKPISDAALYAKVPLAATRHGEVEQPMAEECRQGPTLDEAMTFIGLTSEGVDKFHRWRKECASRRRDSRPRGANEEGDSDVLTD